MTFSNGNRQKWRQNIIILPYDKSRTPELNPSVEIVPIPNNRVNPIGIPNNNEYRYYMKTSMLGRIMNNTACIRCPKY